MKTLAKLWRNKKPPKKIEISKEHLDSVFTIVMVQTVAMKCGIECEVVAAQIYSQVN